MHADGRHGPRSRFAALAVFVVALLGVTVAVAVAQDDDDTTVSTTDETVGTTATTVVGETTLSIETVRSGEAPCEVLDVELTASNPGWDDDVVTTAQVVGRPERFTATPLRVIDAGGDTTVALVAPGPDVDEILLAVGTTSDQVTADGAVVAVAVPAVGDAAVQWNAGDSSGATADRGTGRFVAEGCRSSDEPS